MTVQQLIDLLMAFPPEVPVLREGGDHQDDWRRVHCVRYHARHTLAQEPGVYIE